MIENVEMQRVCPGTEGLGGAQVLMLVFCGIELGHWDLFHPPITMPSG